MTATLHTGDCLEVMRGLLDDSVDSIVTDPPYGLSFMGKAWDKGVPSVEVWREALRVLKPGGHLLAFAGTRTQHRMAVAIEDAGFEIRDMIAWVYGSGFPKSQNVSKAIDKAAGAEREVVGDKLDLPGYHLNGHADTGKYGHGVGGSTPETRLKSAQITAPATEAARQWEGWGTALKPALEPITVARKPLAKGNTVAANVLEYGTGAINVDGCRVEGQNPVKWEIPRGGIWKTDSSICARAMQSTQGRFPANLIHDGSDEPVDLLGDSARFFYCAKTSKKDRNEGLDDLPDKEWRNDGAAIPERANRPFMPSKNNHPTVKPTDLMRYLCRLVTPPGGVVLDPFMGSGSTGRGAVMEGFSFTGIDLEPEYVEIARARVEAAQRKAEDDAKQADLFT